MTRGISRRNTKCHVRSCIHVLFNHKQNQILDIHASPWRFPLLVKLYMSRPTDKMIQGHVMYVASSSVFCIRLRHATVLVIPNYRLE